MANTFLIDKDKTTPGKGTSHSSLPEEKAKEFDYSAPMLPRQIKLLYFIKSHDPL